MVGVARFLILAAGRGLGPCSGCPSCPLLRSPSGRGFSVFALTLGALFRRLSRRLDFGERTPAGPIAPVIRLLCRVSGLSRLARLPLRRAFGFHFYTAAQGGSPFYSVTMVDDLSVTRCGFQRSRCVGFWGHGASPCAPGGQASTGFRGLPLDCLYYSTDRAICQALFFFFALFFGRPFGLPSYKGLSLLRGFAARSANREWDGALG